MIILSGGKSTVNYAPAGDKVWEFETETREWKEIGKLRTERYQHAMSVVAKEDVDRFRACVLP